MNITLDKHYYARLDSKLLGYMGETESRTITVQGYQIDGADLYKLRLAYPDGVQYDVDVTSGTYTVQGSLLRMVGEVKCQLLAIKISDGLQEYVKKSQIFTLRIDSSVSGDPPIPTYEQAAEALEKVLEAELKADECIDSAAAAKTSEDNAAASAEQAATAAQSAAENAAKTAQDSTATAADRQAVEQAAAETLSARGTAVSSAETAAEKAQIAVDSAATASSANTAAQTAKAAAEQAMTAAVESKSTAVNAAQTATQAVQTASEAANTAVSARSTAVQSAEIADSMASSAVQSAQAAESAKTAAETARDTAESKADEISESAEQIATNAEDISELKGDLGDITELPDTTNYIDLSIENMIVVDTNVIPEVSVSGNRVTITQPSRANVKVAFPITADNTDTETVYDIQVKSSVLLNSLARAEIKIKISSGNQGIVITPTLQTEDYSIWSGQGAFVNTNQKYLYILLPYNIPSSTFEISVTKKNVTENIHVKKEAIVDIGYENFDNDTKERLTNVDYFVNRFGGHDSSGKTLVVLNFEQSCDDWYADRQALLEQYGFKGSFALSEPLTTQDQITRLHDLVNKGHDIAIYSGSTNGRPDDVNDTSKQAEWDSYIEYIVNVAKSYGIHNPVAYHCKYNLLGTALYNSLVKYGFKIARCSNASEFGFDDNDSDKCIKTFDRIMTVANTNSFSSDSNGSTPHIWFINKAIKNGWDIAFFGHGMEDVDINTDLSDSVHFKKFILVDICEHLKQCIENGTVEVVTWAEYYKIRSGN